MKKVIDTAILANEFMPKFLEQFAIVIPIGTDTNKHPINNKLCCLYIRFLDAESTSVIVPYYHDESIGIYPWFHEEFGRHNKAIFTLNKKHYQHYLGDHKNLYDLSLLYHMYGEGSLNLDKHTTAAHRQVWNMNEGRADMNRAVPLLKHLEWGDSVADELVPFMKEHKDKLQVEEYVNYNTNALDALYDIETHGLKVDVDEMSKHYPKTSLKYVSEGGYLFSDYNVLTTTGRPSNAFGKVNFSAVNKDDGSRDSFVSRFDGGELVYIDYESFHLRLMADFIEYPIDTDLPLHEYFGRMYFGKNTLTEDEYNESKKITFQSLYGGILPQAKGIDFFEKIDIFMKTLWKNSKLYGYMKSPIFKRKLMFNSIIDPNPQKLFNYFLQVYETESNIQVIQKLNELNSKDRKLVLYMYDGFLFDTSGNVDMSDVISVMESGGKYPVRMYKGDTFGSIVEV